LKKILPSLIPITLSKSFSKTNLCNATNAVFGDFFVLFLSTFSSSRFLIVVLNLGSKLLKGSSASNMFDP